MPFCLSVCFVFVRMQMTSLLEVKPKSIHQAAAVSHHSAHRNNTPTLYKQPLNPQPHMHMRKKMTMKSLRPIRMTSHHLRRLVLQDRRMKSAPCHERGLLHLFGPATNSSLNLSNPLHPQKSVTLGAFTWKKRVFHQSQRRISHKIYRLLDRDQV